MSGAERLRRTPWIERCWSFELSPELDSPAIVARLATAPERAFHLVEDLPTSVQLRRPGGAWSIRTHLGHLTDLEPLFAARIDDLLAGHPELTAWTGNEDTDVAGHEARTAHQLCRAFRDARVATLRKLDSLAPAAFGRAAHHPRLDRSLRLVDVCLFHAEHDDHHLDRVRELAGR